MNDALTISGLTKNYIGIGNHWIFVSDNGTG